MLDSLRVLVVDDCGDNRDTLAMLLRAWGHEPHLAHDGPSALRAAEADPPDVMLLEIGLPGMDGFEVAKRVHEEMVPAMPKAPLLIAVTGRDSEEDRRLSREAGIDLHLTKPLDANVLLRLLQRFQRIIG